MRNEELLVQALRQQGADAFLCCNFHSVNLTQQLFYAYHADVVSIIHSLNFSYIIDTISFSLVDNGFTWSRDYSWDNNETRRHHLGIKDPLCL